MYTINDIMQPFSNRIQNNEKEDINVFFTAIEQLCDYYRLPKSAVVDLQNIAQELYDRGYEDGLNDCQGDCKNQ